MSLRHMIKAFDCKIGSHVQKLVLIKLADNANEDGKCWPSLKRISSDCEISKRTAINAIKSLEQKGFLSVHRERTSADMNKVNLYTLTLGGSESPAPRTCHSLESTNESYNDSSNEQSYPYELVNRAFEHFWKVWKDTKKDIGKTDTTPKGRTKSDKWNKLFNKAYFKNHSEDEFKAEVTKICEFVVAAHNVEGFNRFHNMQCGKLFTEKQWRDE